MLGVTPYVSFKGNCREAIAFYQSALDAVLLFQQTFGESPMSGMGPADHIMHATLKVGNSNVMLCDSPMPNAAEPGGNISLAIGLSDTEQARQVFDNLAAGGTVVMPLEKTYWAEAFGMVTDKFGIQWMVNCEAPQ